VILHFRFDPADERYLRTVFKTFTTWAYEETYSLLFTPRPAGGVPHLLTSAEVDQTSLVEDMMQCVYASKVSSIVGYETWPMKWMPAPLRAPVEDREEIERCCRKLMSRYEKDARYGTGAWAVARARAAWSNAKFVTMAEFKNEWLSRHPALLTMVLDPPAGM
jgi:hypothetical protein